MYTNKEIIIKISYYILKKNITQSNYSSCNSNTKFIGVQNTKPSSLN